MSADQNLEVVIRPEDGEIRLGNSDEGKKDFRKIVVNCKHSARSLSNPNPSITSHEIKGRSCRDGLRQDPAAAFRLEHGAVLLRLAILARIFHSLSHRYDHLPAGGSSDGGSQGICGLDSKPPLRGEIM